jgi:glycosyltransferase involved in cell wall biosynthesis
MGKLAPDILHLHTGGLAVRTADILGARLVPAAARLATIQWPFDWQPGSQIEQQQWRRVSRLLDRIICPSTVALNQQVTAGLSRKRIAILPNAVDVGKIAAGDRDMPRREFGIEHGHILVLFLARIESQKRPMDAIKAFHRASEDVPQARMLVAGTGDLEAQCREYVDQAGLGDRIRFAGYRTDVANLMRAADIYILPTVGESFGVTLVEAMAAGAAILTTRIAPIAGEVVPEDCALFAPLGAVDEFAGAMSKCFGSAELRRTLGENARTAAQERYALNVCAERHIALYASVARRLAKDGSLPARRLAATGPAGEK